MTTINDLAVANSFSPDDKLPMWSNANGVTRALPISVLTDAFLTQDDVSALAASSSIESFISDILPNPEGLPTFTAGTTLALTLEHNYVSGDNIEVHFDGTFQGPDQYSLVAQTLSLTSPIPVGTSYVYVSGGAVRVIGAPSDGTVTTSTLVDGAVTTPKLADGAVTAPKLGANAVVDASVAPTAGIRATKLAFLSATVGAVIGPVQSKLQDFLTVRDFGAKGDGVTDDSAAFQAAINSGICRIPYSALGYVISTALNATNRDFLLIEGVGNVGPQWGLGYQLPLQGSVLIGNTGGYVLDITGSNNVTLRDFVISSQFEITPTVCPNPSAFGIIGGTSNDNSRLGSPGGSGYFFENITVATANIAGSIPIYINNGNLGRFIGVCTLGRGGFCLTKNNPLGLVPPYGTFGTLTASDGNLISGGFFAGYGQAAVLYLETANDTQIDQTYLNYAGGAGTSPYPGPGYGMYIKDCIDVRAKIEQDNFPYMFIMEGNNEGVIIEGITFTTPTPVNPAQPCVGLFNGTQIKNCKFNIQVVDDFTAHNNYHYLTNGTPTMASIINCDFYFDTSTTSNVASFNLTNANPVPYFNNNFRGNTDLNVGTTAMTFLVNGVAATAAQHRTWMNGIRQGTA